MENQKTSNVGENVSLNEEEQNFINDPMEMPGLLKKAREHGSAQKVYNIPDDFPAESNYY